MENASKALIIAGGVLIAILLLTLFSYLFGQMANSSSNIYDTLEKHEISEFNQQFINFDGRKNLTVQDVATLINLAQNSEKNSKFKSKVEIKLNNTNIASTMSSDRWLKNNISSNAQYTCTSVHINTDTLLVDRVELSRN